MRLDKPIELDNTQTMTSLYTPYKAIGYVCDTNAFEVNRLGEENFISVSIGNCFQVYRVSKLANCLISKPVSGAIRSFKALGDETFVAVDKSIHVYKRSDVVHSHTYHSASIRGLVLVGNFLLSYDDTNSIKILDIKARALLSEMRLLQQSSISCMVHPATYVNKVVIGYQNGQIELWNINKKVLVHSFKSHVQYWRSKTRGEEKTSSLSAVTCIEQSPACDVVGVGFASGDILLLNLKLDQVLFGFVQTGGSVTSLSFRADAKAKNYPYLVSASAAGILHVWNLGSSESTGEQVSIKATRGLASSLEEAHKGRISRVAFLAGEPVMISSGEDNTLKVWIFDAPDGSARLLTSREGHSGCPTRIRYYGGSSQVSMRDNADASSCEIVSAGSDGTLRMFNTAISSQNREMSQKTVLKSLGLIRRNELLPNCIGFDFSENRERHWGNLVSIHDNHVNAYLWRYKHKAISETILKPPASKCSGADAHCTAVAFSMCGNFCIIGYKGGSILKYNAQSGQFRGSFPASSLDNLKAGTVAQRAKLPGNVLYGHTVSESAAFKAVHQQDVTGVFVDMTNSTMVSCGLDGKLVFWDFNGQSLLSEVQVGTPLLVMHGFRDANFVAVVGQNRVVYVYDVHSFKLLRKFSGFSQQITDVSFSPDGRRILVSSMDATVRIWELSSSRCLSWLRFGRPILSIAMSLSGEYLCVAQADKTGIYMYADRSMFETVHFWREPVVPSVVEDSEMIEEEGEGEVALDEESRAVVDESEQEPASADEANEMEEALKAREGEDSVSFSSCPKVFWSSLFHLEVIKARNKLSTPVSATPTAPFFLPTVLRGDSTLVFPTEKEYASMQRRQKPSASDVRTAEGDEDAPPAKLAKVVSDEEELASGEDWDQAWNSAWENDDDTEMDSVVTAKSRIINMSKMARSKLIGHLQKGSALEVFSYLKGLSAPAVDIELNSLCLSDIEMQDCPVFNTWLQMLSGRIESGHDFEIVQAYLHRTLMLYSDKVLKASNDTLLGDLRRLSESSAAKSSSFRDSIQRNLCMLKILANIPL